MQKNKKSGGEGERWPRSRKIEIEKMGNTYQRREERERDRETETERERERAYYEPQWNIKFFQIKIGTNQAFDRIKQLRQFQTNNAEMQKNRQVQQRGLVCSIVPSFSACVSENYFSEFSECLSEIG